MFMLQLYRHNEREGELKTIESVRNTAEYVQLFTIACYLFNF